jgi:hypothetical protein
MYDIQRVMARAEQQTAVKTLSSLVDAELKRLAPRHQEQVRRMMTEGSDRERQRAIMSLGWWNELAGRRILDKSLASESASIRDAGLAAIGRWRHSSLTISKFARHARPEVRIEAASLAAQQVQNIPNTLMTIKELFEDKERCVREEAYRTLDQLARLGSCGTQGPFRFIVLPLRSTSSDVVLDAINWLVDCGDNSDQSVIRAKLSLLDRLRRHHDHTIQAAATDARRTICLSPAS